MIKEKSNSTGVFQRKGRKGWWARISHNGREHWYRCDTKTQAREVYGKIKAEIREEKFFPEKYKQRAESVTLQSWIKSYLEGSSNRGKVNEVRYGRRWSLLLKNPLLSQISTEDLRRVQAKMITKMKP